MVCSKPCVSVADAHQGLINDTRLGRPAHLFSPNHSVAMPKNEKKPTTSVMVVTKMPEATAGSARTAPTP